MDTDFSPADLADTLAAVEAELARTPDQDAATRALTALAARTVPGAQFAGVTYVRNGGTSFRSAGETDPVVGAVDAIQYDLHSGPCVDAVVEASTFNAADLRTDDRWPEFARRAVEETGILSMLSYRMFLEGEHDTIAALNLYSREAEAFPAPSETAGLVLATAGALAVSGAAARETVAQLKRALESSREIGIAVGILMTRYLLTREQAVDTLRIISQENNRKVSDISALVAETGDIPPAFLRKRQDG